MHATCNGLDYFQLHLLTRANYDLRIFANIRSDLAFFCFQFLGVLNSKKEKLREVRDQISNKKAAGKLPAEEEEDSTDKTESFENGSDAEKSGDEPAKNVTGTSKDVVTSKPRGRKWITRV